MICIGASVPTTRIPFHQLIQEKKQNQNQNQNPKLRRSISLSNLRSTATARRSTAVEMESASRSQPLILTSGASGRVTALFLLRSLRSLLLLLNSFLLLLLLPFRRRTVIVSEKADGEKSKEVAAVVRVPSAMMVRRKVSEATARRAMAIKRLREMEEEEGERVSLRDFALFPTARGDMMFTQWWTPVAVQTKGLVVLMHGLNEHSGRYNYFAKQLNASGFKVYAMDWIGHGGSDGLHGYVHSLDIAVSDLKAFLEKVLTENPGLPCFCFGHSTGAAIILKTVLDPKIEARINGVVLTSPAIGVQPSHPIVAISPVNLITPNQEKPLREEQRKLSILLIIKLIGTMGGNFEGFIPSDCEYY